MTQSTSFASLPLSAETLTNLELLGYQQMTAIQAASLPLALSGQDIIAQAKTGSGKTASFGISLIEQLNPRFFACQALVLCPTRELAEQVANELRRLARAKDNIKILTLCGGMPFGPQIASLEHGAHIVVGTPGRIQEHLAKQNLALDKISTVVLDEADRMLDMGFIDAIRDILQYAQKRKQTLLYSATYPAQIEALAAEFLQNPQRITVESQHSQQQISQYFFEVADDQRFAAVTHLLWHYRPTACVAFCATKQQCQDLEEYLQSKDISALALHGDLDQKQRERVLALFSQQSCSVLVATDVAARGLDIEDLPLVINVELARDPQVHVHRIGRTGRAGANGVALSIVTAKEAGRANAIEQELNTHLQWQAINQLTQTDISPLLPEMKSVCFAAGRKEKLRRGDILGALTGDVGLSGSDVGKIILFDHCAYVAIKRNVAERALGRLQHAKIKGRFIKVRSA